MKNSLAVRALLAGISMAAASAALAQDNDAQPGQTGVSGSTVAQATPADPATEDSDEEILVVGTHIEGADVTDVLPVTVLEVEDIEATAATSGDELFRSTNILISSISACSLSEAAGGALKRLSTASCRAFLIGVNVEASTSVVITTATSVLVPSTLSKNVWKILIEAAYIPARMLVSGMYTSALLITMSMSHRR